MQLQRGTIVLLLLALSLGGAVYWLERRRPAQPEASSSQDQPIFSFQEDQVQALQIETPQQVLGFVRGSEAATPVPEVPAASGEVPQLPDLPQTTDWRMQQPVQAPAQDASVAYLLNLMATARADRTLRVPTSRRGEFGFDKPLATVKVTLQDQTHHQLVLGQFNFDQSYLYAVADPPASLTDPSAQTLEVLLVPTVFETAVNRPLTEWQQPDQPPNSSPSDPAAQPSVPRSP
jgi:hypothetical protein